MTGTQPLDFICGLDEWGIFAVAVFLLILGTGVLALFVGLAIQFAIRELRRRVVG